MQLGDFGINILSTAQDHIPTKPRSNKKPKLYSTHLRMQQLSNMVE